MFNKDKFEHEAAIHMRGDYNYAFNPVEAMDRDMYYKDLRYGQRACTPESYSPPAMF